MWHMLTIYANFMSLICLRFGIEMVPNEPEGASHMEDDVPLYEGFHWDSVANISPVSAFPNKCSMSESSDVTIGTTESCLILKDGEPPSVLNLQDTAKPGLQAVHLLLEECDKKRGNEGIAQAKEHLKEMEVVQDTEPVDGESSCMSSAELNGGKKRRAVGVSVLWQCF